MNTKLQRVVSRFFYYLLDWPYILYFNFRFLPISQAYKLPVLLHKTKVVGGGKISITAKNVYMGMIRIGHRAVPHFPDNGAVIANWGHIVFLGSARLGNSCGVEVRPKGVLTFGDNFCATAGVHIICHYKIEFSSCNLVGWNTFIMDTNSHRLITETGEFDSVGYAPVEIGSHNWIGAGCTVLPGTSTPSYCVSGTRSLLNKDYRVFGCKIVLAGCPAKIVKQGVYHDIDNDLIEIP